MPDKAMNGGDGGRRRSWTRALLNMLKGPGSRRTLTAPEMPPPYEIVEDLVPESNAKALK